MAEERSSGATAADLGITPISRPKLYEQIAESLEAMIRSGRLKPGDSLPAERDIMASFDTGRPSVREAFLLLQKRGLIVTESGRRARVRQPNVGNVLQSLHSVVHMVMADDLTFKHMFDARRFMETAMARNAALNITAAQLELLGHRLAANKQAIGDRAQFVRSDALFHRTLFEIEGNPVFEAVHDSFAGWLEERRNTIERSSFTETFAYTQHTKIYEAIAAREPDTAEKAMREHLAGWWASWKNQKEPPAPGNG